MLAIVHLLGMRAFDAATSSVRIVKSCNLSDSSSRAKLDSQIDRLSNVARDHVDRFRAISKEATSSISSGRGTERAHRDRSKDAVWVSLRGSSSASTVTESHGNAGAPLEAIRGTR